LVAGHLALVKFVKKVGVQGNHSLHASRKAACSRRNVFVRHDVSHLRSKKEGGTQIDDLDDENIEELKGLVPQGRAVIIKINQSVEGKWDSVMPH
jgi:hypothetical protein